MIKMAAEHTPCYYELSKLQCYLSLIVISGAFLVSDTVTVTQEPMFSSILQEGDLIVNCSHSENSNYNFFWYRQVPGKVKLQALGTLFSHSDQLEEETGASLNMRLRGEWMHKGQRMRLHFKGLQQNDVGLYLCAVRDQLGAATVVQMARAPLHQPRGSLSAPCSWKEGDRPRRGRFSELLREAADLLRPGHPERARSWRGHDREPSRMRWKEAREARGGRKGSIRPPRG
nr:uncharacterized protein LOC110078356 [Pogona vitticeps]